MSSQKFQYFGNICFHLCIVFWVARGVPYDIMNNMATSLTGVTNCHFLALGGSVSLQI